MKRILLLCIITILSQNSWAQYSENKKGLEVLEKDPQKAQSYFQKALEYNSTDSRIHYNLGNSLVHSQDYKNAIIAYETALTNSASKYKIATHYNLGTAALHNNDLEKSIQHLKIALQNNPNFHAARKNLEIALKKKKDQQNSDQNKPDQNRNKDQEFSQKTNSTDLSQHNNETLETYIQQQEKQARQNFINRQMEQMRHQDKELSW